MSGRGKYDRSAARAKREALKSGTEYVGKVDLKKRPETDAEIDARIAERFEVLEEITSAVLAGTSRAMIVSGPAGLGKSFTVEKALAEWDPEGTKHASIKGYVKATGLYKMLFQYRHPGNVIVFDDADSIFFDDVALNLLKAVCDTTETRRVSWLSEAIFIDEDSAEPVPKSFTFDGSIIFITNKDFDADIERATKLAPHLNAMMSRADYIDLTMKSRQDYLVRVRQVVRQGLLAHLEKQHQVDVVKFIETHANSLRELSLRMAIKLGNIRKSGGNWERRARIVCIK